MNQKHALDAHDESNSLKIKCKNNDNENDLICDKILNLELNLNTFNCKKKAFFENKTEAIYPISSMR